MASLAANGGIASLAKDGDGMACKDVHRTLTGTFHGPMPVLRPGAHARGEDGDGMVPTVVGVSLEGGDGARRHPAMSLYRDSYGYGPRAPTPHRGGTDRTMLPILPVPTKKKKKTIHRPRPQAKRRCDPKAGAAAVDANHSAVDEFQAAFPAPPANVADPVPPAQSDNDQALVLAAEAAAALLDADGVGESTIDAAALLGVEDSVPPAQPPPKNEDVNKLPTDDSCQESCQDDRSEPSTNKTAQSRFEPTLSSQISGPLGSNVQTVSSQPPNVPMSCVHSNFLQYYYGNEAVGVQHALSLKVEEKKDDNVSVDNGTVKTLKSFCSKYPKQNEKKRKGMKHEDDAKPSVSLDRPTMATQQPPYGAAQSPAENEEATPQVEIVDGEIVVRPSSFIPDPTNRISTKAIDAEYGTAIVEDETTSTLGIVQAKYDSYTTKLRTKPNRWGVGETKAFYMALRQCGSDFSMMQMFVPGRTRSELKNKFKTESRHHPRLVDLAMDPKSRVKLDLSVFGDELVIPEEVTPVRMVLPSTKEEAPDERLGSVGTTNVRIAETPETTAAAVLQQTEQGDMDRIFDHLFDDNVEVAPSEKRADKSGTAGANETTVGDKAASVGNEKNEAIRPALLLAPVSTPKVKKTKKFKAKPMAKKAVAKK